MRLALRISVLGFCLALGATPDARAQVAQVAQDVPPELAKNILRLMEITGALQLGHQMASGMIQQTLKTLRASEPDLPPRAAEIVAQMIQAEYDKAFAPGGEMSKILTTVYAKHFTAEEIRGLIAFYESPLGRKVVDTLPAVAKESAALSLQWTATHMPGLLKEIHARLRAEGLIK